jgi:hypothetical protein
LPFDSRTIFNAWRRVIREDRSLIFEHASNRTVFAAAAFRSNFPTRRFDLNFSQNSF